MKSGKKFFLTFTIFFFCIAFSSSALAGAWKARWKMATLAPDGIGWARQIKKIVIPAVEEVTENSLKVKVYWGGVMGDDEDYIKKMRINQLQGAGLSGQGVVLAVPEMAVVELPFLFRNYAEVDYIKEKMAGTFDKIAKKNGYMSIAWIDQDFDLLFSTQNDLSTLEKLSHAKALSWFGPVEAAVYQVLGATPVPVNMPEAPASLRQGIGNTIIDPSAWMVGTQLYSIAKYTSPLKIRYAPALIIVTWKSWMTMPKEYQDKYYKLRAGVVSEFCAEVRKDNEKSLEAMLKNGMKMVQPSQETIAAIQTKTRPLWDELAGELYPKGLLDEVLANLAEYRKAHEN